VQLHTPLPSNIKREAVTLDPLAALSASSNKDGDVYEDEYSKARHPQQETEVEAKTKGIFGSVESLTREFLQECSVPPIDPSSVPKNLSGMKRLAKHNMWRNILEISASSSPDISKHAFETMDNESICSLSLRYEAFFRLKMFDELSSEVGKALSQLAHLQESTTDAVMNLQRDYLRIALTILFSETQFMIGHGHEALAQLYVLRLTQERSEVQTAEGSKWIMKLGLSVVNMLMRQHQWTNAIAELKDLLRSFRTSKTEEKSPLYCCYEVLLLCKLARVMLHVGAVADGERYLDLARQMMQSSGGAGDLTAFIEDYLVISGGLALQCKNQVHFIYFYAFVP